MYAVIETGGKQYKVQPGDFIQIEKLEGDKGSSLAFDKVLMVAEPGTENSEIWLGKPLLAGAKVTGQIVGQGRGDKIIIFKYKRRKQYRKTKGHRQEYTQILITALDNGSGKKSELDSASKKEKLGTFQTHLKPKVKAEAKTA
jgi:large subunit ribosomal protein L21